MDHVVTDPEGNEKIADGYDGGACLPGGICSKGLECEKKVCVVKEDEVSDEAETSDEDAVKPVPEQNECFGMEATYDVIPYKVVTFGTKNFQRDLYPESKVVIAGDNACSMIAYTQGDAIIAPIKCEGVHQVTAGGSFETCTYGGALDLVDGSKGCNWNCVDYK